MNTYELTVVLPGKAKSKEKATKEKIEKLVKKYSGEVKKSETWGEIEFSYEIKKEASGFFLYFNLELDSKGVREINEKLRVDGEIIRYLIVRI